MQENKKLYLTSPFHSVITLYIRKDTPIPKVLGLLKKEAILIDNIKSRETRSYLKTAMTSVQTFLSRIPDPHKPLIIVANESELVYTDDILVDRDWYRCGSEFYSEPLEEQKARNLWPIGIICLDTKEATIGYVSDRVQILKYMTSGIPGKSHKGGSSQRRYEREREMAVAAFFKRIGDAAKLFIENYPIEELLISGCGQTKNEFLAAKYLDYRLKAKASETLDTQYTGEHGVRETLHKALPSLQRNAYAKEVQITEEVFEALGKNSDSIVYGKDEIKQHLHLIRKIIKVEEITEEYPVETVILHFKGEHYDKIKSLGGICGIK